MAEKDHKLLTKIKEYHSEILYWFHESASKGCFDSLPDSNNEGESR